MMSRDFCRNDSSPQGRWRFRSGEGVITMQNSVEKAMDSRDSLVT